MLVAKFCPLSFIFNNNNNNNNVETHAPVSGGPRGEEQRLNESSSVNSGQPGVTNVTCRDCFVLSASYSTSNKYSVLYCRFDIVSRVHCTQTDIRTSQCHCIADVSTRRRAHCQPPTSSTTSSWQIGLRTCITYVIYEQHRVRHEHETKQL